MWLSCHTYTGDVHRIPSVMTSSNENIFRVTGHLCGEFTGPVNSPHKGQWRGALMFSLICTRIKGWINNVKAGDLRRYRTHYDAIVMQATYLLCDNSYCCVTSVLLEFQARDDIALFYFGLHAIINPSSGLVVDVPALLSYYYINVALISKCIK